MIQVCFGNTVGKQPNSWL